MNEERWSRLPAAFTDLLPDHTGHIENGPGSPTAIAISPLTDHSAGLEYSSLL